MRVFVERIKELQTDRRGLVKNVLWRLACYLEATEEELRVIDEHLLGDEPILFIGPSEPAGLQAAGRLGWRARDMLGNWVVTDNPIEFDWAIILNARIVEKCESFASLVDTAAGFEGTVEIDL